MDFIAWFVTITIAFHASRTAEKIVKAGTGSEGELVGWISGFAAWFALASVATQYAGQYLLLAGVAVGTEVALMVADATVRKYFPLLETKGGNDNEKTEPDQIEETNDDAETDDLEDASETANLIEEVFDGTEWSEAKRFVDNMIDEDLPNLIDLRESLGEDIERAEERIGRLGKGTRNDGRRKDLQAYLDSLNALYEKIDAGIANTVATLDKLLVIGRERQVNGATDATDRAVRLLTETHRNNEILLASQREVDRLESH